MQALTPVFSVSYDKFYGVLAISVSARADAKQHTLP